MFFLFVLKSSKRNSTGKSYRLLKIKILYYLGKASQHHVRLVLNATLMPDINGACKTTPAQSYLDARSTVGTVPMLCPYKIIFDGLIPYRIRNAFHAACISA